MIIDAHQHFWLMKERGDNWPPPELNTIHRDFLPSDLAPELSASGVRGTVVVQSLASVDDTRYLLDLASADESILGVVGWVDMKAGDAPEIISALTRHRKLKGLRPMLQDIPDDNWVDDESLDPAARSMVEHGLVFDALVLERHLPSLQAFATRYTELSVVIDHGAKPRIAEGRITEWRRAMKRLASLPNTFCKLSGLLTEAGNQRPEAVRPYAETVLELFGPERTLWGSDWPVIKLAGSYSDWLQRCQQIVPRAHHPAVFAANACRIYRL